MGTTIEQSNDCLLVGSLAVVNHLQEGGKLNSEALTSHLRKDYLCLVEFTGPRASSKESIVSDGVPKGQSATTVHFRTGAIRSPSFRPATPALLLDHQLDPLHRWQRSRLCERVEHLPRS